MGTRGRKLPDAIARRRAVSLAGHRGDAATARGSLADGDPGVRAAALGALSRLSDLAPAELAAGLRDPDPSVRRRALELSPTHPGVPIVALLGDPDASVVEAAAWASGERAPAEPGAVTALVGVAAGHDDPLCREAAVAALGALGDEAGLAAILAATHDRPAVRRRAVLALAPFEGPAVDEALRRALDDRDWQVRQAAEDLLGG